MTRPKNTTTISKANKDGNYWIYYDTLEGRIRIKRSASQILKAVKHYKNCAFKDDF